MAKKTGKKNTQKNWMGASEILLQNIQDDQPLRR